jgi:hypothetical protein
VDLWRHTSPDSARASTTPDGLLCALRWHARWEIDCECHLGRVEFESESL